MKLIVLFLVMTAYSITAVVGQTILVNEDFESGALPANWARTQDSSSVGWEFGTALGSTFFPVPSHTKYAASNDDKYDDNSFLANQAYEDRLITPVMDLRPFNNSGVIMQFSYLQTGTWNSVGSVEVTNDGGANWILLDSIPSSESWTSHFVNLSLWTVDSTVQVCFRHNDMGSWADGFAIDDVLIKSVPQVDAAMKSLDLTEYMAAGNNPISGTVFNYGFQSINTMKISYSINGSAAVTDSLFGLSIPLGGTYSFTHSVSANLTVPGIYTVIAWVSGVNSMTDSIYWNDTLVQKVHTVSSVPTKYVVLGVHTSADDGYSPDALRKMEIIKSDFVNCEPVVIHDDDQMEISAGDLLQSAFISAIPGGTVDHLLFEEELAVEVPRYNWHDRVESRLNEIVPVSVSIENLNYEPASRLVTFDAKARFVGNIDGELRLNAWILENDVSGSGTGWDQKNYYSFSSSSIGGANHYYYGYPDPMTNFGHDHVLRNTLDGPWGQPTSIATPAVDGDSAVKSYSTVLDTAFNEANIHILVMVQRYDTSVSNRQIYNASSTELSSVLIVNTDDQLAAGKMQAYPNPFSKEICVSGPDNGPQIDRIRVFDASGKQIRMLQGSANRALSGKLVWDGENERGMEVSAGLYLIRVEHGREIFSIRAIKTR